jgi:hypothetical protein
MNTRKSKKNRQKAMLSALSKLTTSQKNILHLIIIGSGLSALPNRPAYYKMQCSRFSGNLNVVLEYLSLLTIPECDKVAMAYIDDYTKQIKARIDGAV